MTKIYSDNFENNLFGYPPEKKQEGKPINQQTNIHGHHISVRELKKIHEAEIAKQAGGLQKQTESSNLKRHSATAIKPKDETKADKTADEITEKILHGESVGVSEVKKEHPQKEVDPLAAWLDAYEKEEKTGKDQIQELRAIYENWSGFEKNLKTELTQTSSPAPASEEKEKANSLESEDVPPRQTTTIEERTKLAEQEWGDFAYDYRDYEKKEETIEQKSVPEKIRAPEPEIQAYREPRPGEDIYNNAQFAKFAEHLEGLKNIDKKLVEKKVDGQVTPDIKLVDRKKSLLSDFLGLFFRRDRSKETKNALKTILNTIQTSIRLKRTVYYDGSSNEPKDLIKLRDDFLKTDYAKNIIKHSPEVASIVATPLLTSLDNEVYKSEEIKKLNNEFQKLIKAPFYDGNKVLKFIDSLPDRIKRVQAAEAALSEIKAADRKPIDDLSKVKLKVQISSKGDDPNTVLDETIKTERGFYDGAVALKAYYETLYATGSLSLAQYEEFSVWDKIIDGSKTLIDNLEKANDAQHLSEQLKDIYYDNPRIQKNKDLSLDIKKYLDHKNLDDQVKSFLRAAYKQGQLLGLTGSNNPAEFAKKLKEVFQTKEEKITDPFQQFLNDKDIKQFLNAEDLEKKIANYRLGSTFDKKIQNFLEDNYNKVLVGVENQDDVRELAQGFRDLVLKPRTTHPLAQFLTDNNLEKIPFDKINDFLNDENLKDSVQKFLLARELDTELVSFLDSTIPGERLKVYQEAFLPENIKNYLEAFVTAVPKFSSLDKQLKFTIDNDIGAKKLSQIFSEEHQQLRPDAFIAKVPQRLPRHELLLGQVIKKLGSFPEDSNARILKEAIESNLSYVKNYLNYINAINVL